MANSTSLRVDLLVLTGIYRQGAIMPRTFTHTDGSLMAPADG